MRLPLASLMRWSPVDGRLSGDRSLMMSASAFFSAVR